MLSDNIDMCDTYNNISDLIMQKHNALPVLLSTDGGFGEAVRTVNHRTLATALCVDTDAVCMTTGGRSI